MAIYISLQATLRRIEAACVRFQRDPAEVTLLPVSKTFPAEALREAYAAGARSFGENYVQEALDKIEALIDLRPQLQWHLIGPLQSNKTRAVAEHFDWVHSIDRLRIAERLAAQRPPELPPLNVCIQVNVSGEASKSGVAPEETAALAQAVAALPRLRLRGLMAVPEPLADFEAQRAPHHRVAQLYQALRAQGLALDTLSLGMSADLEAAIAEGATLVRVGSAIFGQRPRSPAEQDLAPSREEFHRNTAGLPPEGQGKMHLLRAKISPGVTPFTGISTRATP